MKKFVRRLVFSLHEAYIHAPITRIEKTLSPVYLESLNSEIWMNERCEQYVTGFAFFLCSPIIRYYHIVWPHFHGITAVFRLSPFQCSYLVMWLCIYRELLDDESDELTSTSFTRHRTLSCCTVTFTVYIVNLLCYNTRGSSQSGV